MEYPDLYKFLNARDVHYWFEGSVLLRPLSYFREIEGPEWIRDGEENISTFRARSVYFEDSTREEEKIAASRMNKIGFGIGNVKDVQISDFQTTMRLRDVYVLCLSMGPLRSAKEAMCNTAPAEYRYNACIEFMNPHLLFRRIFSEGEVDGSPVKELFYRVQCGPISYSKRTITVDDEEPIHFGPFYKPRIFSPQQEFRFVLHPVGRTGAPVNIKFDPRGDLFRQVF